MNTIFILLWAAFSQAFRAVADNKNQEYSGSKFMENPELWRISSLWLNELEETYKIGFPKKFGLMRHRNLSTVPNHNSALDEDRTCQNVSFRSVKQNIRLIHNYGYDYVLHAAIDEMLETPRARLFENDYYSDIPTYEYKGASTINLSEVVALFGSKTPEAFSGNTSIQNFKEILVLILYSCKKLHVTKDQELKENLTKSFQSTDIFQEMIKNPMVRIFSGENYTGEFEDYHSGKRKIFPGLAKRKDRT
ncbi:unnamed protein product [Allacma fusca]|uniref:Uncharacterized protein n=1 Tax=Allacma fusca TaxID=39272 RepID=A0A8J2KY55_9HEXA|nr:unnamed protein product [Allacma fusca]